MFTRQSIYCVLLAFLAVGQALPAASSSWPMLARDPARSGSTPDEIRPPFERKWFRLFADEGLNSGLQVIGERVSPSNPNSPLQLYVGTLAGVLHALHPESGQDIWTYKADGAILHTCAAAEGKVFFGGADGFVYAVNAADGTLAWKQPLGWAIWNSPVVHEGRIIIGDRTGHLEALETASGKSVWSASTGGPLLNSPALDAKAGRVYAGSEDMRVYAFALADGREQWRSEKLPGVSFRGYHPVIAPDGSVLITAAPGISLDTFNPVLLDMVKEIFGDFASWRHKKEENDRWRDANFKQMAEPGTYEAQLAYLRKRLTEQPVYQTFFVLDPKTGRQKFVAPIVYGESMNGPGAPALVTPDGKVIVKFQALLRSRYEHYSPFLNVGYLDTSTGHITPIMDPSRTYGWHDSLLLVHDEQCQLTVSGRLLINTHQDNVNGLDLDTLKGYPEPFCQNVHEPQPGEAASIWSRLWRHQPLPVGKEWLARGTAVYGGGSVLDTPVSVIGDTFYFLPTHEINSGVAVMAYQMKAGGTAAQKVELPKVKLTQDEWAKIRELPWDWDTLQMARLNHVLASLPGPVPGTRMQSLTNEAATAVAAISDADLNSFIRKPPEDLNRVPATRSKADVWWVNRLHESVRELVSQPWRPLVFPAGKHPEEAYRFFNEPTETLYTLALAFPHLDDATQNLVKDHVAKMTAPGGVLGDGTGLKFYPAAQGAVRSAYDAPPASLLKLQDHYPRSDLARLYPLWLWAHVTGEWSLLEKRWPQWRELAAQPPNKMEEDCRNGHAAGLMAYCRIAEHVKDAAAAQQGFQLARQALRERLAFEFAHPRGGLIATVPVNRSVFARWDHLTPDLAALLRQYAQPIHQHLMKVYVDYHRPTWWLAWNLELVVRNESPLSFPTLSLDIFAARALILQEPAARLQHYLDIPWCRADEAYIQKLALALRGGGN